MLKMEKKIYRFTLVALFAALLCSCSSNYVDVVPHNAKAVVAINPKQLGTDRELGALGKILGVESVEHCGIDLKEKIMSQKDMDVLTRWLKLSAKVSSIEEFVKAM